MLTEEKSKSVGSIILGNPSDALHRRPGFQSTKHELP